MFLTNEFLHRRGSNRGRFGSAVRNARAPCAVMNDRDGPMLERASATANAVAFMLANSLKSGVKKPASWAAAAPCSARRSTNRLRPWAARCNSRANLHHKRIPPAPMPESSPRQRPGPSRARPLRIAGRSIPRTECERTRKRGKKSSDAGLEPATSRSVVGRAIQLRQPDRWRRESYLACRCKSPQ